MPKYGENETGVFVLKGSVLRKILREMNKNFLKGKDLSEESDQKEEFDFLDIIPFLSLKNYKVLTAAYILEENKLGFNTLEEARYHEERMKQGIKY